MKTIWKRLLPFWIALISMAIYYFSTPPTRLWGAIFIVPAIWAAVIVPNRIGWRPEAPLKRRGFWRRSFFWLACFFTRGEYRQYWLASCPFWLVTLVWVSYPHPATTLGWLALSCYLACYFPLFVMQSRVLWKVFRLPVWLATTLSWLAVEALRNVVFGGFSLAGLSYALYERPKLIQIADLLGEYGVSTMIVLVGSLLGCGLIGVPSSRVGDDRSRRSSSPRLISFAFMIVLATYLDGVSTTSRLDKLESDGFAHGSRPARLALLQCGTTYCFPTPPELTRQVEDTYLALAKEASDDPTGYDAIVWPEGTYPGFFMDYGYDPATTPETTPVKDTSDLGLRSDQRRFSRDFITRRMRSERLQYANLSARLQTPALLGTASAVFDEEGREKSHNALVYVPCFGTEEESAALGADVLEHAPTSSYYDPNIKAFRRYDKVELVMFGEYIPFAKYLPDGWELKAACADAELGRGRGPTTFKIPSRDGTRSYVVAPHICFESIVPHFVSNQLAELREANVDPDILMNVSNDGWFRNGQQTDLHLASMVFRAIENRRPLATATHGGFSAYVDAAGRVRKKGERGGTEIVDARIAIVKTHPRGLLTFGEGDSLQFVSVADLMRRLGFMVFVASVLAQFVTIAVRRRAAQPSRRSEGNE